MQKESEKHGLKLDVKLENLSWIENMPWVVGSNYYTGTIDEDKKPHGYGRVVEDFGRYICES